MYHVVATAVDVPPHTGAARTDAKWARERTLSVEMDHIAVSARVETSGEKVGKRKIGTRLPTLNIGRGESALAGNRMSAQLASHPHLP